MRAYCTRVVADENGQTRFEDLAFEPEAGVRRAPAEPLHNAPFVAATDAFWVGAPPSWGGEAYHPAPRRIAFTTLHGGYEVSVSDGAVRRFPVGCVLVLATRKHRTPN